MYNSSFLGFSWGAVAGRFQPYECAGFLNAKTQHFFGPSMSLLFFFFVFPFHSWWVVPRHTTLGPNPRDTYARPPHLAPIFSALSAPAFSRDS